ncbi:MAG TPA: tetratricopeptide repeat protein [Polyangia bacterium]|nr:tetratricopeptide repeat protein [Polyangia bacterium]
MAVGAGCSEVRGRKLVQEGGELYKRGRYAEAVRVFEQAEALVPDLPELWLNKGYTCRQLVVPGSKDPQSQRAVACALGAFKRLGQLRPGDARADQLTIETMFDAGEWPALERLFLERNRQKPNDVDVVRGLQQVYDKSGRWQQSLEWAKRIPAIRADDPEAFYGVGTYIWQILQSKGGGPEMAAYDPRPRLPPAGAAPAAVEIPGGARNVKGKVPTAAPPSPTAPPPPVPGPDALSGPLRAELADEGIRYLEEAVRLRPRYSEAMSYLALLWRQKSFSYFDDVPQWQAAVDKANEWQKKANLARTGKT